MSDRELLQTLLERLNQLPEALRQTIADHLWATIPTFEWAWGYSQDLATGTDLHARKHTSNLFLIRSVTAIVPVGASALVTLGEVVLPLPPGVNHLPHLAYVLADSDTRKINLRAGSGETLLWLTGEVLPTYSVIS